MESVRSYGEQLKKYIKLHAQESPGFENVFWDQFHTVEGTHRIHSADSTIGYILVLSKNNNRTIQFSFQH